MRLRAALLLIPLFLAACASFDPARTDYVFQEVFYLTTRAPTQDPDPEKRYGEERGDPEFGVAMVVMDPRKSLSTFAQAQPNRVLHQTRATRRGPIQQVREMSQPDFLQGMAAYAEGAAIQAEVGVGAAGGGSSREVEEVLVFIHGYRRTFEDALVNAAHLRHQLAFPGPVIAFAWPSTHKVSGYLADMENLDWSQPQFRRLLGLVARHFPGARIHIMAHSLGNRALLETLPALPPEATEPEGWRWGEIVMMAPDVDRATFMDQTAAQLRAFPARITLYVSAEDFPLMASGQVNQSPRLGDSRSGVPILEGIETVDVSDAITIFNGHGYYEADPATIEDFYYLVREGLGAAQRPTLEEARAEAGVYWRLRGR